MALSDAKAELLTVRIRQQTDAVVGTDHLRQTLATSEADKKSLGGQLAALQSDLAALRAENVALRRSAGGAEGDHHENRELRLRLNEIAANVVRLTQTIAAGDGAPMAAEGNGHGAARQPQPVPVAGEPAAARRWHDTRRAPARAPARRRPPLTGRPRRCRDRPFARSI